MCVRVSCVCVCVVCVRACDLCVCVCVRARVHHRCQEEKTTECRRTHGRSEKMVHAKDLTLYVLSMEHILYIHNT